MLFCTTHNVPSGKRCRQAEIPFYLSLAFCEGYFFEEKAPQPLRNHRHRRIEMNSEIKGILQVFCAAVLWSVSGVILKSLDVSLAWLLSVRFLCGGVFLSPFLLKTKIAPYKTLFWTGIAMAVFLLSFSVTTRISSSAMAVSMQYAAPMYVLGFGFIKYRKIDPSKFLVFILIAIGVFLNIWDGMKAANITGVLLGIVIGLAFLAYSYGMQNIRQGSLLGIVSLLNFICAAFFLLLLPFDFSPMPTTPSDFLVIAVSGLLLSGISYALYGAGIRKIKLETAMIVALAEPILNPLWVYLKMGIVPSLPTLIGLGFILMGTVVDVAVSFFKKTD